MRRLINIPILFILGFWILGNIQPKAQVDNLALAFDGNGDFISLNTTGKPVSGNASFTVEAWFSISQPPTPCINKFRRLFSLNSTSGPLSQFEVGECSGKLAVAWLNTNGTSGGNQPYTKPLGTGCHHLAVVRNSITTYTGSATAPNLIFL